MTVSSIKGGDRRTFLSRLLTVPLVTAYPPQGTAEGAARRQGEHKPFVKFCLNAYSFNRPLLDGSISLEEVFEFCAAQGLAGVDITGYYFKGYPDVPTDEALYAVKRRAFSLGLEICGTGVRNDFTHTDPKMRPENIKLVKDWIEVAQKLGGQTLRIFSGTRRPPEHLRGQTLHRMLADIRECVEYGRAHGVVVVLQNHDDFVKTADETIEVMESIRSPWFGLMLDIGSFRTGDPYDEIARTVKYAVTWQIKEKVYVNGEETEVDADKLMTVIKASGFRGYLPIETLGEGDAKAKIRILHQKLLRALET